VYGLLGTGCQDDLARMIRLCERIVAAAAPFAVRIEAPIDGGSRAATIGRLAGLRAALADGGVPLELVADDWCNTLEDVQAFVDAGAADVIQIKTPDLGGLASTIAALQVCRANGVKAYVGGTCNETDVSARACTHVAAAMHADVLLAKPGMGVDEGMMIVRNELERLLMHADLARPQDQRGEELS
jgi:methylaspartate ammonia-lyase